MAAQPYILPICTIQHDFQAVVGDVLDGKVPDDSFWISCYKTGEPSVHGKAVASLDDSDRDKVHYESKDGVELKHHGEDVYSVSCSSLGIDPTRMIVPTESFTDASDRKTGGITAFDVSPDGSQIATGYDDGSVFVRPTKSKDLPASVSCKAHLNTVTSVRFFPSSRVLLTSGIDFALTILPAYPPDEPQYTTMRLTPSRTLKGHIRAVTSTGIIARGRNVLSGAKDGTVRLWDMPTGAQIRMMIAGGNTSLPVLSLAVAQRASAAATEGDELIDDREVETTDKVAFCGLQDGSFEVLDLRTKGATFRSSVPTPGSRAALQAIAYDPTRALLATGTASGLVSIYDVRSLGQPPTASFKRNDAPVEDLAFVSLRGSPFSLAADADGKNGEATGLAVGTEDGLPYVTSLSPDQPQVRELVGANCDAVRFVRAIGGELWSASDDRIVRRYRM